MISQRAFEAVTALLTGAFGIAVVVSSIENGITWSTAGVGAGTFPFLAGIIILGASLINLLRSFAESSRIIVTGRNLRRLAGLFVPAVLFVAAIPFVGMYVASAVYILAVVSGREGLSIVWAVLLACATPLALYLVFEQMFQVSLPHGALGQALGF